MAEIINCQQCQKKLRVPEETLGQTVKCPSCGAVFVAILGQPAPAPPPLPPPRPHAIQSPLPDAPRRRKRPVLFEESDEAEDFLQRDDEDRPRKRRRRSDEEDEDNPRGLPSKSSMDKNSPGWKSVRSGIGLVATSLLVAIGLGLVNGIIGWIMGVAMADGVDPNQPVKLEWNRSKFRNSILIQSILSTVFLCVYFFMNMLGHRKIIAIPDRKGITSRTLARTTLILVSISTVFSLISNIAAIFVNQAMFSGDGNPQMQNGNGLLWLVSIPGLLSACCWLGSYFTFLLVLRNICLAFSRKDLASTVMGFLITSVCIALVTLVMTGIILAVVGLAFFNGFGGLRPGIQPNPINPQAAAGMVFGVLGLMCFLALIGLVCFGMFIWYIILLFQVRGVLDAPNPVD